jgi:glutamate 5-kinase
MQTRQQITTAKRWVVKIGSALLTNDGRGLDKESIGHWVDQLAELRRNGSEIVLVSSGSVAEGMTRLGWHKRPHALHELQAAAAVGQMGLVQVYESHFQRHGLHTAQILLTHEDLADRQRYLNARSTLRSLLALGVIPVINENDTVATDEIRFGDNDTLAALVANFSEADVLVILTDQQGLFDKDPRKHADAKLISLGQAGDPALEDLAGGAGKLGMGGMLTKVRAAARAARSGAATVIAYGSETDILLRLSRGENLGTLLLSDDEPLLARKQWLAGQLKVKGKLFIDQGAVRVLCDQGRSLLPVGLTAVDGQFRRGELVACIAPDGSEVARGLVNYNADESRRLIGKSTKQIESILGYVDESELIHRDDMVITAGER